jgi:hypothetical protein
MLLKVTKNSIIKKQTFMSQAVNRIFLNKKKKVFDYESTNN